MTKPKNKHIEKDRSNIGPRTRTMIECKCTLHCSGSKLVDPRTFEKHQQEMDRLRAIASGSQGSSRSRIIKNKTDNRLTPIPIQRQQRQKESIELIDEIQPSSDDYSSDDLKSTADQGVVKKRKYYSKFHDPTFDQFNESEPMIEEDRDEDLELPVYSDSAAEEDYQGSSDDENSFEQFTAPNLEDLLDFGTVSDNDTKFSDSWIWILLWIFKYQSRFRLPDTAIDSLIKFIRMILIDINPRVFKDFPTSSYMARKLLGIGKQEQIYAVCPSCNALYNVAEILPQNQATSLKCTHVEFPNHSQHRQRQACGTELTNKVPIVNGFIRRPKMLFPIPSLKNQIITMYQRPDFEELLQKWTNRKSETGLYSDIYDGEIWKTFPSSLENSDSRFFTSEMANSHLGIMVNLDWFQPFESSAYSCGVIYGVICNLPREVRFKRENMLYLGLLPGPNEVKLHKINHYLSPIVDELLEFWNGFNLPSSNKHPNGKRIRLAVICCSNDIPAARKLCGHISALIGCHRCYKRANTGGEKPNFGGFEDMDEWFRERDLEEHRRNAEDWRKCKTDNERKQHVSDTHVRWSEMLRLPYFNPIRHLVVDPMHCLFLGIAHWIVKRLWIDSGKLDKSDLEKIENRVKSIKVPSDLGRIPHKIATGEGFSGFTADQWKNFILIYAIPSLWDLLEGSDREILNNFVRACSLLVCRIIDDDVLNEAHFRLLSVALLIEENYGSAAITPNIHLSLHLAECCRDYGPLYSFWCYSFERMNGVLGSYPNSRRQIEPELLRIIMQSWKLDDLISSQSDDLKLTEALELIKSRQTTGSLAANDNSNFTELFQFMQIYRQILDQTITGSERFPGEMMHPKKDRVELSEQVYNLLVRYYNVAYDNLEFVTIAQIVSRNINENFIVVRPDVNQYGRIRIGAEIFGSTLATRYIRNSHILAMFIIDNDVTELWPGEVQFYFEHSVKLQAKTVTHFLAYVKWHVKVTVHKTRFYCQTGSDESNISNIELWEKTYHEFDRDSIIPIHNIYSRFVPVNFIVGVRKQKEYIAVVPINRQFHL